MTVMRTTVAPPNCSSTPPGRQRSPTPACAPPPPFGVANMGEHPGELMELIESRMRTGQAYGDGKHFPVLSHNMNAVVAALRCAFASAKAMDADRAAIEQALARSRGATSQYNTPAHVQARYRALRAKAFP